MINNPKGTDNAALASVWTSALAVLVDDINDALAHVSYVFPSNTNLICTLTALATANTYGTWAEIVDSAATALSDAFSAAAGHVTSFLIENVSQVNTIYMLQLSYGGARTLISEIRFAGGTKFQSPDNHARFWVPIIPSGETIYYKMKTASAVADTCDVHLRYHLH